jgi:large subunit ribosomal protein L20
MARVKRGFKARRRRNRFFKAAKGFFGSRSRLFKVTKVAVMHAWKDAWVGRKLRKRDMRRLWITRIGAAAKQRGTSYSRMMGGLRKAGVALDRKILADIAVSDPEGFAAVARLAGAAK